MGKLFLMEKAINGGIKLKKLKLVNVFPIASFLVLFYLFFLVSGCVKQTQQNLTGPGFEQFDGSGFRNFDRNGFNQQWEDGFVSDRIKIALGLSVGASKEQVMDALELPVDANQQQIRDALIEKEIMPNRRDRIE